MKFDNPEHYRHWQYQNIVNRVFIVALILTYSFSVISLNPLNVIPKLSWMIVFYFFFVPMSVFMCFMIWYAIIKGSAFFWKLLS